MVRAFIEELKNLMSDFHPGDRVVCRWGTDEYDRVGTIIDPLVNYSGDVEFNKCVSRPACVVRFDNAPTKPNTINGVVNEVVPHGCIHKPDDIEKYLNDLMEAKRKLDDYNSITGIPPECLIDR